MELYLQIFQVLRPLLEFLVALLAAFLMTKLSKRLGYGNVKTLQEALNMRAEGVVFTVYQQLVKPLKKRGLWTPQEAENAHRLAQELIRKTDPKLVQALRDAGVNVDCAIIQAIERAVALVKEQVQPKDNPQQPASTAAQESK